MRRELTRARGLPTLKREAICLPVSSSPELNAARTRSLLDIVTSLDNIISPILLLTTLVLRANPSYSRTIRKFLNKKREHQDTSHIRHLRNPTRDALLVCSDSNKPFSFPDGLQYGNQFFFDLGFTQKTSGPHPCFYIERTLRHTFFSIIDHP